MLPFFSTANPSRDRNSRVRTTRSSTRAAIEQAERTRESQVTQNQHVVSSTQLSSHDRNQKNWDLREQNDSKLKQNQSRCSERRGGPSTFQNLESGQSSSGDNKTSTEQIVAGVKGVDDQVQGKLPSTSYPSAAVPTKWPSYTSSSFTAINVTEDGVILSLFPRIITPQLTMINAKPLIIDVPDTVSGEITHEMVLDVAERLRKPDTGIGVKHDEAVPDHRCNNFTRPKSPTRTLSTSTAVTSFERTRSSPIFRNIDDPQPVTRRKWLHKVIDGYPDPTVPLPKGVSLRCICEKYPNHLIGQNLVPFIHNRWTAAKILSCVKQGGDKLKFAITHKAMAARLRKAQKDLSYKTNREGLK